MFVVEGFLGEAELVELRSLLSAIRYIDGSLTSGSAGKVVKNNLQCDQQDPKYAQANDIVRRSMRACALFQSHA